MVSWKKIGGTRAPLLVACTLAGAIVAQLAQTGLAVRRALAPMPAPGPASATVPTTRGHDFAAAMTTVVEAHLFGSAPAQQPVAAQPRLAAATEWVLSGTLLGRTPDTGSAIIGPTATTTRFRAVGQELANGFRLVQVLADRVIIEAQGQRIAVKMTRSTLAVPLLADASVPASPSGVGDSSYVRQATVQHERAPADVPKGAADEVVAAAWETRFAESASPAAALRPQPHRGRDGRYDGLEVTATAASNPGRFGLQTADVITRINGETFSTPLRARQALDLISDGAPVTLTVERNGAERQIALNLPDGG